VLSDLLRQNHMRTAVIAELADRLSSGSGRSNDGIWLLAALVLTAAIPVLLLGGWIAYITADQERSYARKAATEALTQVAHRIESEISREMQVAETLASSAALDDGNLGDFYREATRIVAARPLWETASLTKPDKEHVLNVLRPLGTPLGPVMDSESFNAVLRLRKPVLGGLGPYQAAIGKQLVSLRVPVIREGDLRYILTIGLLPDQIGTILDQAGLPTGWAGTVIDAKGRMVARTPDTHGASADAKTPAVQEAIARGGSSSRTTQTREGMDIETIHRVLADTDGWSVHVGVPLAELNAPVSRSLRLLFGGTAASVGLAIALGLVIAREIARRRRMEALESAAALLDSEKRGALAIDAAELGTWRWDLHVNEFSGCGRFCALLGLSSGRSGETNWPAEQIFAALDPSHRATLASFGAACLESGKSSSVAFQIQSDDRGKYWLRAAGRAEGSPNHRHIIHGVLADIDILKRAEVERSDLLRRLASAQEEERRRISRELHDQIGQTVTGLSLGLKALEQGLAKDSSGKAATEQVRWLEQLTAQIGRDIHRTASDLRPTAIDDLGIFKAIEAYVAEWQERYGVRVDIQTFGRDNLLPPDVAAVLYRLVQEGLNNVLKHAQASKVSLVLERKSEGLALVLEDDGIGFDPEAAPRNVSGSGRAPGLGLSGMKERVELLGGKIAVESAPGNGSAIFVQVPLDEPVNVR
jgi:two-component system, NarL family, sensor histidine kinase UhpB